MNETLSKLVDPKLYLLEERTKIIAFLLGIMAVLLCVGLWWGDISHYHVEIMLDTIHLYLWTALLLVYAAVKIYPNTHCVVNTVTCCVGLWIWIYVFLTFVLFDNQSPSPLESMLLLPVILEAWELLLNVVNMHMTCKWRKHVDK